MSHDEAPRIAVAADGRAIGYRRLGSGPAAILLHASPRSAAALLPLARRLATRHTVIALDTPGFGWSDALRTPRPDAHDFGHALVAALDALGIARAPVYGSHTGAAIAVAAAIDHPDRVTALALDGYSCFTPTEQAEHLAAYLTPIHPEWDGAWLAWLWSRVKDQFTFFPWNLRGQVARLPRPLRTPAAMQAVIEDFLAAGDAYRPGYAAAFRYDHLEALRRVTVPTGAMCRSDDLLFPHLERLTDLPPCVELKAIGHDPAATDDDEWEAAMAAALARGASSEVPPPDLHHRPGVMEAVRVPGGVIGLIRDAGGHAVGQAGEARPIVLLPAIPGSARAEAPLARALARHRPVIRMDLPGFGLSTLGGTGVGAIAAALREALHQAGVAAFDVAALGESASIGAALAALAPGARLVVLDPVMEQWREPLRDRMACVTPRMDGAHLLAAWHQLRDACLWRPWFQATPACAIAFGPEPDAGRLHTILADWMRGGEAGRATLEAALAAPFDPPPGAAVHAGPDRLARAAAILDVLAPPP